LGSRETERISDQRGRVKRFTKELASNEPAFLFGFIESDNKVKATKKISGAFPYTNFKAAIDEMLSTKQ
jgi:hypothetical protein